MKAVVVQQDKTVKVEHKPIPKLGPQDILVKAIAIGQNPTDWKTAYYRAPPGVIVGADVVGEVIEIGSEVPEGEVRKGEIRWLYVRSCASQENGAFAEFVTSPWDTTSLVPPNITPQEAASIPIPFGTAVQAIHLILGIPQYPEKSEGDWIVIWSGASAVGQFAIQLAKLSGLKVATTASPHRWDALRELGADFLVDYKDPEAVKKLKEITNNTLRFGVDCISEGGTLQKMQEIFGPEGGKLAATLFDFRGLLRPEVVTKPALAYTALGFDVDFGTLFFPAGPEDRALHVKWCKLSTQLFGEGKLKERTFQSNPWHIAGNNALRIIGP
ncbi:NAD(P)-binding protein [Sistotremastrum suecicum HHB10207 ss-3]|uniref:NAD(P)-binding protein n=1 Tax=Sistotremastrum suecicum HHB10207 ss-3 TaxID=1314776 RepID=A0A166ACT8_9AGAM|nr:NAD(P)-binding protein [Sistotremastrum suecicum HHB10207 ss-3]